MAIPTPPQVTRQIITRADLARALTAHLRTATITLRLTPGQVRFATHQVATSRP
jgi:hypothetical protein